MTIHVQPIILANIFIVTNINDGIGDTFYHQISSTPWLLMRLRLTNELRVTMGYLVPQSTHSSECASKVERIGHFCFVIFRQACLHHHQILSCIWFWFSMCQIFKQHFLKFCATVKPLKWFHIKVERIGYSYFVINAIIIVVTALKSCTTQLTIFQLADEARLNSLKEQTGKKLLFGTNRH